MESNEILKLVITNIQKIVPNISNETIDRNSVLSPLGLDSVGRAELIEQTLEDLHLQVSRFEFHAAHNLGELADLLAKQFKKV